MSGPYLTPEELSRELTVPTATLTDWRYRDTGPTFYRIGRAVRYARADVDRWLATCKARQ